MKKEVGVFFSGAELPNNCGDCWVMEGACDLWEHNFPDFSQRPKECPLFGVELVTED